MDQNRNERMEEKVKPNKLDILLIYPPSKTQVHSHCPMGVLLLASVLESEGHSVNIIDANAQLKRRSVEDIVETAMKDRPDIIGITLVTPLVKDAYKLSRELKTKGFKLIAGGPHATLLPEEPLDYGFDAVVVGEGENTILEAVKAVSGQMNITEVDGLVYKSSNGDIKTNSPRAIMKDLDLLPLPARHLINLKDYGNPNLALVFSSRGCPARCSYCAGGLFGKKYRFRTANDVFSEILKINEDYGITHFHFVDDAMTMNKERFKEICNQFIQNRNNFTWSMMTRIDSINSDMLELAYKGGCRQIDYGVESGNPETLRKIHKPHTVEMVRKIVPLTAKAGIKPFVFFILGFPWEDPDSIHITYELMHELSPYVDVFHPAVASILIPFPGTEIYEEYKYSYGFEKWWLSEERSFSAASLDSHFFYETLLFHKGAVLDFDFFKYKMETKHKIINVFKFMYFHSIRNSNKISFYLKSFLFSLSIKLSISFPRLENFIFKPIKYFKSMSYNNI